jgi:hypothetical protein
VKKQQIACRRKGLPSGPLSIAERLSELQSQGWKG